MTESTVWFESGPDVVPASLASLALVLAGLQSYLEAVGPDGRATATRPEALLRVQVALAQVRELSIRG